MNNKLSIQTILLHWLTAVPFLAALGIGLYMEDLPNGPDKFELMANHKSIGLMVLLIAAIRVLWRVKEGHISSISKAPFWQETMAKVVHYVLLIATILMPVSGIMMSVGGGRALEFFGIQLIAAGDKIEWLSEIGHTFHGLAPKVIMLALFLHIVGALKHQFVEKDGTISRMLGKGNKA
ncbi:cytochrome b [Leucothrix pacifica]|uniref:Cytochrome B n=1 Tax=Leucothrix pacifica TaxID=1247513 RepID=A0A317CEB2_9GAMM|nr:cytochrome b [Leucothrix pacifica]PWQ96898.1 cytochrome B [Leucothrix pacifica]